MTDIECRECGYVRETGERYPTLATCEKCGSANVGYVDGDPFYEDGWTDLRGDGSGTDPETSGFEWVGSGGREGTQSDRREDDSMRFKKLPVEVEVEGQVDEETTVETPEGDIEASPGDVIVRGVHGERYPVKPGIFAKTYAPADPESEEAFRFYASVAPKGVEVLFEEDGDGVTITGVAVPDPGDLGPEEFDRAVEFARELSSVMGLSDPPVDMESNEGGA